MNPSSLNQNDASGHAIDYWQVVKNRYGLIFLTFLLVFMTAAVITYAKTKRFTSTALVQVEPVRTSKLLGAAFGDVGGQMMTPSFFRNEFEVITAPKTLEIVADNLELEERWKLEKKDVVSRLRAITRADNVRGTEFIEIEVEYTDKYDARDIANEVARAYQHRRNQRERDVANQTLDAIEEQLRQQQDTVIDKKRSLEALAKARDIITSSTAGGGNAGAIENKISETAEMELFRLQSEEVQITSQIQSLLELESEQLMAYASGLNLPENIVRRLYPQYLDTKREYAAAGATGLGPNHPSMVARRDILRGMESDLAEGVTGLREILRTQLEQVRRRLADAEDIKNEAKGNAMTTASNLFEYNDAKRDFDMAQDMLQQMRLKFAAEKAQLEIPRLPITIHAEAEVPAAPSSPNVPLFLSLGAIVGLVAGVGIAFLLEMLDTSVKSLEDVERFLEVPVLAVVPQDVGVLHKQSGMSPDAEAYRILRTNIEFNRKNPDDNAITVVSGGAGEGKSTTLVNLAYICAQGGYTTLMIDGDLRRPRLHTFFDINNSVGLTNYLTTELMLEDVILQTSVDNLYFMPSGILPADAAGILNSRRMSELIQDVKQRFDLVLVDSPPILGVSDASVLASEVDLTMIVVQHRKLPRNMLLRVKQAVENVGGHVIGVVLNNVDVRSDSQYQYYTSYYTYYAPSSVEPQEMAPQTPIESEKGSKDKGDDLY